MTKKGKGRDVLHSDIINKKISREEYEAKNNLYRPEIKNSQKKEKVLNKNDIIGIIRSYIGDINVESISRTVIRKVEDKLNFDKKRRGIL